VGLTIVQLLPALDVGGVERGTVEVAAEAVRRGHRALVVSAGGRLTGELRSAGAEHHAWPVGGKSPWSLRLLPRLRALFEGVDIVHVRSRWPAWLAWLAWRSLPRARRPALVSTVHGPYTVNPYSAVMVKAEHIIAISRFIRDYVLNSYPGVPAERIRVIYRGVSAQEYPRGFRPGAEWLRRFAQEHPQTEGRFLVTIAARLTRWKGQSDFIRLIAKLKQQGLPVHGLIAGGAGSGRRGYLRELQREVAAAGLGRDVSFLGARADLREIMAISGACVSLARIPEAFGRTVLEALSLGTPVVGYDHGGTGEILAAMFPQGRCAPGDLDAVAARIARLREAPLAPAAEHPFGLQRMLNETMELYESAARAQSRS
jgi:glycosyltransferase involved in cell wall biosynthesis